MFGVEGGEPVLVAYCGRCDQVGLRAVVARVLADGTIVVPAGSRGSGRWVQVTDPRALVAADPSLRDPAAVVAYRRAVKEGKAEALPGVTVTTAPRTRWVVLAGKRQAVRCSRGHATRVERARLLAMSRSRRTVVLTAQGHAL